MKNATQWAPSKYVLCKGKLRASRDPQEVSVGSRLISDLIAQLYQEAFARHARGRMLDLGCGKVPFYAAYKDYVTETVCVDWQNTMHKNPHIDIECDLNQPLPLESEGFDTILLSDVLEHIAEPWQLWKEMARLLRPGGKILMNTPFFYWLHEQPHDYYRYTEYALRRFAAQASLTVLELQPVGGAPEILADILAKNLAHVPGVGRPLAAFIQWATFHGVKSSVGSKLSRKTAKLFPLGYFLVVQK